MIIPQKLEKLILQERFNIGSFSNSDIEMDIGGNFYCDGSNESHSFPSFFKKSDGAYQIHLITEGLERGLAIAGLSFDIDEDLEIVKVLQIQGLVDKEYFKEYLDLLKEVDWKKLLLSYMVSLSKKLNAAEISVQGYRNNLSVGETYEFVREVGEKVDFNNFLVFSNRKMRKLTDSILISSDDPNKSYHLWPKRAYQIYDQTALDLGFSPDGNGDYVLDLK